MFTLTAVTFLLTIFPDGRDAVITVMEFFVELISILPAVMVPMGLFVFVPKEMVVKHLGKSSEIKGLLLYSLECCQQGPLYVAFPMAKALLKKKRSYFRYHRLSFRIGVYKDSLGDGGSVRNFCTLMTENPSHFAEVSKFVFALSSPAGFVRCQLWK